MMDEEYYTCVNGRWTLKPEFEYFVEWHTVEDNYRTEVFTSVLSKNNLPNCHVYPSGNIAVEKGLREFLSHIPLHDVMISVHEK
jgi:hypothetical protein